MYVASSSCFSSEGLKPLVAIARAKALSEIESHARNRTPKLVFKSAILARKHRQHRIEFSDDI
jgi:hypothetical protein